ncbi:MAG: nicotinate-nucleotide adenylyltransferase [Rhodothermales bacterium]
MTSSATDRQRVGIFGGSFNPPHVAHLIVAEIVREQFTLDHILWIPNYRSPLKDEAGLVDATDRLAMTRIATEANDAFSVSNIEVKRAGASYTIDTVRALQDQRPETIFHLMIGSDSLADIDRWHEPRRLLERVPFIVYPRPGDEDVEAPNDMRERISFADAPLLDLSSTGIRERIRTGRSIRYMVPEGVRDYVDTHRLYR